MPSEPLVLSDSRLIAEFVRQSEFKAFFEKRFAVGPDYAALLFKNGELIDAFKGGHFSVGGLMTKLKGVVGGSHHISMLLADLKPFTIDMPIRGVSKDQVEIAGVARLEMQVNPDKPENILGMMHGAARRPGADGEPGRRSLGKPDLLERIRPHLTERVVQSILNRMSADEIRGEVGLQDNLQGNMMREVERVAGDIGLIVNAVSVEWAMNAVEAENMERAEIERQQAAIDWQMDMLKRDLERQADAAEFQFKTQVDLQKLESAAEDELRIMALNSEIEFVDARETAQRRQELDVLGHEITMLREERVARFENELAEAGQVVDLKQKQADLRTIDREIEKLDFLQAAELKKVGALTDHEILRSGNRVQTDHLSDLVDLDNKSEDAEVDRRLREKTAEREHELARIKTEADARASQFAAASNMSDAQILAIQAGFSQDVAAVLAEQAKASASNDAQSMALMREMVEAAKEAKVSSEAQARDMFRMGMEGAVGVAHGAGGKQGGAGGPGQTEAPATVECPKCGRTNSAKAKFCVGCGAKLRV
ncbi:MAG: hypothetical protein AAFX03_10965 [Pseudomonadota bacterium]